MNFLAFLRSKGIQYRAHSKRGEVWIECPFCNDDKPRLGLNYQKNLGHCFRCNWKSRHAVKMLLREWKFIEQYFEDVQDVQETEHKEALELPDGFFLLSEVSKKDGDLKREPLQYIVGRGVTPAQVKSKHLGATLEGYWRFRVLIPVHYHQKLLGIVGRDYIGQEPKYLNSTGTRSLYNLKRAETAILSEGCLKALAIERAVSSEPASVALLGHTITETQIDQLRDAGVKRLVLFSDPDKAGIRGTLKVAEALATESFRVEICHPFPTKQADEMKPEEIREVISKAVPLSVRLVRAVELKLRGL